MPGHAEIEIVPGQPLTLTNSFFNEKLRAKLVRFKNIDKRVHLSGEIAGVPISRLGR